MSLLDQLRTLSAAACDEIIDLVESAGAEASVSILITHPGAGANDAVVVGSHELSELAEITAELVKREAAGGVGSGTVTQDGYTPDEAVTVN